MDAVNDETLNQYFSLLKDVLTEHGILHSPSQIYNVDESGVPLDPKAPNVVAKRGVKKVRYRMSGKKGQVTVVGCANAADQVLPPMIILIPKSSITHGQKMKSLERSMASVTKGGSRQNCLRHG